MTRIGIETGVARTALMVAAARAQETHRPDALAQDPFAEHFVRATPATAHWPTRIEDAPGGETNPLWGTLGRYFGLRTRVLDDTLLAAADGGTRQVVILGAGLDTRAHRLPWPPDTTVLELDQPQVLTFKHKVLNALAATPRAIRHARPVDLRDPGWPETLRAAGFSPARPTAWLAEGLFLYLPAASETEILSTVHALSAPGSTVTFEVKSRLESAETRAHPVYTVARSEIGVDLLGLFDPQPRPDSPAHLRTLGWAVTTHSPFHFTTVHGRGPRPEPHSPLQANRWVFAHKTGSVP